VYMYLYKSLTTRKLVADLCQQVTRYKGYMKSLKIPQGQSESVNRRRIDFTMAKGERTKGQIPTQQSS
jgi:hypothetical protein